MIKHILLTCMNCNLLINKTITPSIIIVIVHREIHKVEFSILRYRIPFILSLSVKTLLILVRVTFHILIIHNQVRHETENSYLVLECIMIIF